MKHLSDEELQIYLDGGAAAGAARLAEHLRECPACRKACDEYRALYVALADDSRVCVPERAEAADRSDAVAGAWAIGVALAGAAAVFFSVGGFGPETGRVASGLWQLSRRALELPASLGRSVISADQAVGMAVLAGLVICAVLALDRFLLGPRLTATGARALERQG